MKRGAEKQLSKDDGDIIEQEDGEEPRRGMQKADESVLAGRKIRSLPKRSSAISLGSTTDGHTSAPAPEVPPVPKFDGFAGFGSPSASSSSFTFTSPASTPTFGTPATSTGSIFGSAAPKSLTPSVSPSASGATKAFASVLSTPSIPAASSAKKEGVNPAALKYYSSLRGLNVSFLSAISKAVEQDPFADVSDMVTHYKNFRISVQKEFDDDKPKATASTSNSLSAKPSDMPADTTLKPQAVPIFFGSAGMLSSSSYKPPPAMPAPPSTFSGFGKMSTPSSNTPTPPASGGFTPTSDAAAPTTSGFSLPTPSTTPTASSSPAKSAFGTTSNDPDLFPSSAPSKPSTDSPPKPPSAFGLFSSPSDSLFGTKFTAPGDTSSSPFGGSIFVSSPKSPPEADKEKEKEIKTEPGPAASTSLFGSSASPSNPFNIPDKPATTSLFGSSPSVFGSSGSSPSGTGATAAKPAPGFGLFGSSKGGTFGNPVGFGFGTAPKASGGETSTTSAAPTSVFSSKSSGFGGSAFSGFGAPSAKPVEASGSQEEEEEAGSSAIAASDTADESKPSPTKNHDEEGEGEENEETTHAAKSKVYKLYKKDDGTQEWMDMGIGMLRLKTHKATGSRRVLLRNSSTGKITINFNIYAGLNPSLTTKYLTFVGHDEDGVSVTYKLRTQSDHHATELKHALDREIAFVKGKAESQE